jgi:2-hydroxychromene-2-carboxylate isomerase
MITFHFDFLSPYAYLAWKALPPLAARHHREIRPVPTLLAAMLAHGQTKGPAEIPAKRVYVFKDCVRSAAALGLPLSPPPTHPFNPLLALRLCVQLDGEAQRKAIDALYDATWAGGPGCEDPAAVAATLTAAGLDGAALVAAAGSAEAKAALRAATEEAIGAGVFGVPTMRADGELFWGLDAFGHLDRFLAGDDPVKGVDLARWANLPASASR